MVDLFATGGVFGSVKSWKRLSGSTLIQDVTFQISSSNILDAASAGARTLKAADFDYVQPNSIEAALEYLDDASIENRLLAGGQSLMAIMNFRLAQPERLIDLGIIETLRFVHDRHDEVNHNDHGPHAADKNNQGRPHARFLARLLVVHVHVSYRQTHHGRPHVTVVIHHRSAHDVQQATEGEHGASKVQAECCRLGLHVFDGCRQERDGLVVAQNVQQTNRHEKQSERHQRLVDLVSARQFLETDRLLCNKQ